MRKFSKLCFFFVACFSSLSAIADEAQVKAKFESFSKTGAVSSVKRAPVGDGLYEVVLRNGQIVYTDENVTYYYLGGDLLRTSDRQSLTAQTRERLAHIDVATLPIKNALKYVKGNGDRVIYTFEDPNCGYCKRLHAELDQLENVTIYTFVISVLGDDSDRKAQAVLCADDPAKAWSAWMSQGQVLQDRACQAKLDASDSLAADVRISGTPTIFFENGKRITGYVTKDKIDAAINAAIAEKATEALSKKPADKP